MLSFCIKIDLRPSIDVMFFGVIALVLSGSFALVARLQDCMPPSLGSASGVRGTDETAAAAGSMAATWTSSLSLLER